MYARFKLDEELQLKKSESIKIKKESKDCYVVVIKLHIKGADIPDPDPHPDKDHYRDVDLGTEIYMGNPIVKFSSLSGHDSSTFNIQVGSGTKIPGTTDFRAVNRSEKSE